MIRPPPLRLSHHSASRAAPQPPASAPTLPEQFAHTGISLQQLFSILKSYWKQTVIIALAMTIVVAISVKMMAKTYSAMATLIVNYENKDPLAAQNLPAEMLANFVATQTELITSPVILLPVIDRLKLTDDKDFTAGFAGGDANALREYIGKQLNDAVAVDQGRGGQLMYVTASARNPVRAADIANAVSDVYLEEERRRANDPAGERAQRYSAELAELRDKAQAAQDKVTAFRQANGITDLTAANTNTEMQQLETLQQKLTEAQNQRRAIQSKQTGEQASSDEVLGSNTIQTLKGQLTAQQAELAQDSSVYGPNHPKVVELKAQMQATQAALQRELQTLSDNTNTQLTRAKELEDSFSRAVADQRAKVLNLRKLQDDGAKLTLELESAQAVYKRALDGYDQIVFAAVGNFTNVSFISRATPPLKSSKPNKPKLLAMGVLGGIFLGLIGPLCYELILNRRVRCRDDIEREFGIPVLALFGPIPTANPA